MHPSNWLEEYAHGIAEIRKIRSNVEFDGKK